MLVKWLLGELVNCTRERLNNHTTKKSSNLHWIGLVEKQRLTISRVWVHENESCSSEVLGGRGEVVGDR